MKGKYVINLDDNFKGEINLEKGVRRDLSELFKVLFFV